MLLAAALTVPLHAQVVPNDAIVDGRTLPEWTAEWWKWMLPIPPDQNPHLDPDGSFAHVRQPEGSVFFLAGVFGLSPGTVTRTFTVPEDKFLLMPVLEVVWNNIDTVPPLPVEQLLDFAAGVVQNPRELHAVVDGVPVPDLLQRRVTAPVFSIAFPDTDNIFTWIAGHSITGLVDPNVADGYWLMLQPLPVGQHVLHYGGTYADPFFFPNDIVANITVVPVPLPERVAELIAQVNQSNLPLHRRRALLATLDAARHSFASGRLLPGINQLHAFQNQVRAQVVRNDQALAYSLVEAAQRIIARAASRLNHSGKVSAKGGTP